MTLLLTPCEKAVLRRWVNRQQCSEGRAKLSGALNLPSVTMRAGTVRHLVNWLGRQQHLPQLASAMHHMLERRLVHGVLHTGETRGAGSVGASD